MGGLRQLLSAAFALVCGCSQSTAVRVHVDAAQPMTKLSLNVAVARSPTPLARTFALDAMHLPGMVTLILPDVQVGVSAALDGTSESGTQLHAAGQTMSVPHKTVDLSLHLDAIGGAADLATTADLGSRDLVSVADQMPGPDLGPSPDFGGPLNGWFNIVNTNSQLCIDLATATVGATIVQNTCDACSNPPCWTQLWRFVDVGGGYYEIQNRQFSSDCLEARQQGGTVSGVQLDLWNCWGGQNQQWMPVLQNNIFYHFVMPYTGCTDSGNPGTNNCCMDVTNGYTNAGQPLQQWNCNGSGAQTYILTPRP
jgi:hypothetical protein